MIDRLLTITVLRTLNFEWTIQYAACHMVDAQRKKRICCKLQLKPKSRVVYGVEPRMDMCPNSLCLAAD